MEKIKNDLYLCILNDYGSINNPLINKTFGNWEIGINGDIIHKQGKLTITKSRLSDRDWISHLLFKPYMIGEWNDFIQCYWIACHLAGINSIEMDIYI
jgi:hypothetical protein